MNVRALGIARVLLGVIFLVRSTPLLFLFPGLVRNHGGPLLGWPTDGFRFALFGLVLPGLVVKALVIVRGVATLLFTLGVRARLAGVVASVSAYIIYSQEPFSFIFTLHVLYEATFLLALTDATSTFALHPEPARSPRSSVWLVRAFVVSIYAWSAIAKLRVSWLDGSTLLRLRETGYLEGPFSTALLRNAGSARVAAWSVVVVEAAIGPLLLLRRTRVVGIAIACVLHVAVEITAHPDVLGWAMVALLLSFWPEEDHLGMGGREHAPSRQPSEQ